VEKFSLANQKLTATAVNAAEFAQSGKWDVMTSLDAEFEHGFTDCWV